MDNGQWKQYALPMDDERISKMDNGWKTTHGLQKEYMLPMDDEEDNPDG